MRYCRIIKKKDGWNKKILSSRLPESNQRPYNECVTVTVVCSTNWAKSRDADGTMRKTSNRYPNRWYSVLSVLNSKCVSLTLTGRTAHSSVTPQYNTTQHITSHHIISMFNASKIYWYSNNSSRLKTTVQEWKTYNNGNFSTLIPLFWKEKNENPWKIKSVTL